MKKIIIFILLFILLFISANISTAQYFHNNIDLNNDADVGTQIIQTEDALYLLSLSRCMDNSENCTGIIKTNLDGDIIWKALIDSLSIGGLYSMVYADESIYLLTYDWLNPERNAVIILRLNIDGGLIGHWELAQNLDEVLINGIEKTEDGFLLSLRYNHPSGNRRGWLGFYDASFNLLKEMDYAIAHDKVGLGARTMIDAEGNIFIANNQLENPLEHRGFVRKLNIDGNLLWEKALEISESGEAVANIIKLDNGTYAASWELGFDEGHPPVIYGIDSDGNTLWQHVFYEQYGNRLRYIFKAINGDIIGVGLDYYLGDDFPDLAGRSGWVFRMTQEGELLWERLIADHSFLEALPGVGQELWSGIELENGDLVFLGTIQDTFPNGIPFLNNPNLWSLRTDSEGCLVPNCSDVQIINGDSIFVYTSVNDIKSKPNDQNPFFLSPNPVNEKLTVTLNQDENTSGKEVSIKVRDILGRVILTKNKVNLPFDIDVSAWQQGVYFLQISDRYILKCIKT